MKIKLEAEIRDCRDCDLLQFRGFGINPEHIGESQILWECGHHRGRMCFTVFPCQAYPCPLLVHE